MSVISELQDESVSTLSADQKSKLKELAEKFASAEASFHFALKNAQDARQALADYVDGL